MSGMVTKSAFTRIKRRGMAFISMLLVWLLLSRFEIASLWFAVLSALFVAGLMPLSPPSQWRIKPFSLVGFFVYFVAQSVVSGCDLLLRLLRGKGAIFPLRKAFPLTLKGEDERLLLIVCLNLMPGTLVIASNADSIELHLIHPAVFHHEKFTELEQHISGLLVQQKLEGVTS